MSDKKSKKSSIKSRESEIGFSFFSHSIYGGEGEPVLSSVDMTVLNSLEKLKGGAPAILATSTKIKLTDIVGSIDKLERNGLVEMDEKEITEVGEKWAFCSLTQQGNRVAHGFKQFFESD